MRVCVCMSECTCACVHVHVAFFKQHFPLLAWNKKTKCQIIVIIIIRPVFIILCAVWDERERCTLTHGRFEPCKFAYFVSFDISVTHIHTHTHTCCTLSNSIFGICSHSLSLLLSSLVCLLACLFVLGINFPRFVRVMHSCNPHNNNNPAAMNSTFYAWMLGIILCDACLPFCDHYYSTAHTHTRTRARIHTTQFIIFTNIIFSLRNSIARNKNNWRKHWNDFT